MERKNKRQRKGGSERAAGPWPCQGRRSRRAGRQRAGSTERPARPLPRAAPSPPGAAALLAPCGGGGQTHTHAFFGVQKKKKRKSNFWQVPASPFPPPPPAPRGELCCCPREGSAGPGRAGGLRAPTPQRVGRAGVSPRLSGPQQPRRRGGGGGSRPGGLPCQARRDRPWGGGVGGSGRRPPHRR